MLQSKFCSELKQLYLLSIEYSELCHTVIIGQF